MGSYGTQVLDETTLAPQTSVSAPPCPSKPADAQAHFRPSPASDDAPCASDDATCASDDAPLESMSSAALQGGALRGLPAGLQPTARLGDADRSASRRTRSSWFAIVSIPHLLDITLIQQICPKHRQLQELRTPCARRAGRR